VTLTCTCSRYWFYVTGEDAEGIVLEYGPLARILGIKCHIWLLARDRTQALESITKCVRLVKTGSPVSCTLEPST
jgi:hypothetical protein